MNKYWLPILFSFNFGVPVRRLRQVIGIIVQLYLRTIGLSDSSTVRLKSGAIEEQKETRSAISTRTPPPQKMAM